MININFDKEIRIFYKIRLYVKKNNSDEILYYDDGISELEKIDEDLKYLFDRLNKSDKVIKYSRVTSNEFHFDLKDDYKMIIIVGTCLMTASDYSKMVKEGHFGIKALAERVFETE